MVKRHKGEGKMKRRREIGGEDELKEIVDMKAVGMYEE